jgi:cytochrome c oxidase cbb3-type subunit 3
MKKTISTALLSFAVVSIAFGGDQKYGTPEQFQTIFTYGLGLIGFLLVILIIYLFGLVRMISKLLYQTEESKAYDQAFEAQPFWEKFFNMHPLSFEKKLTLEHSYDGIEELNNPTPPWFNFLFYGTIAFGVVYLINYHVLGAKLQDAEYNEEVVMAEKAREEILKKYADSINEDNVKPLTDAKGIAEGKTIYVKYCVACHGAEGQGGVGPNLTDKYWLHGASMKEVFHTITEGVPTKGMISWKKQLNPLQIQQVSSFVLSLKGTNPANPKEPQGEIVN